MDLKLNLLNQARKHGKIKDENTNDKRESLNRNNKENLMKQLKAELDEEIKDRKMIEHKQNIINSSSTGSSVSSNSSRKIRSKSVTFLDEISTDDEGLTNSPSNLNKNLGVSNEYILNDLKKKSKKKKKSLIH